MTVSFPGVASPGEQDQGSQREVIPVTLWGGLYALLLELPEPHSVLTLSRGAEGSEAATEETGIAGGRGLVLA